jgi:hypothetical protein
MREGVLSKKCPVAAQGVYLSSEVFDLKPISIPTWLGISWINVALRDPAIQKRRNTAALQDASENSARGRAVTLWSAAVLRRFWRRIGT